MIRDKVCHLQVLMAFQGEIWYIVSVEYLRFQHLHLDMKGLQDNEWVFSEEYGTKGGVLF